MTVPFSLGAMFEEKIGLNAKKDELEVRTWYVLDV